MTTADLKVNGLGCELDDDKDAILNSVDACPASSEGVTVNAKAVKLIPIKMA